MTAFSAMQLLERAGRITRGTITYRGVDITRAKGRDLRALHGAQISMIFQNPRAASIPFAPSVCRLPMRLVRIEARQPVTRAGGRAICSR